MASRRWDRVADFCRAWRPGVDGAPLSPSGTRLGLVKRLPPGADPELCRSLFRPLYLILCSAFPRPLAKGQGSRREMRALGKDDEPSRRHLFRLRLACLLIEAECAADTPRLWGHPGVQKALGFAAAVLADEFPSRPPRGESCLSTSSPAPTATASAA